eukprot:scaffold85549_cov22-Cyclotella_meneghiniana.AAC.2
MMTYSLIAASSLIQPNKTPKAHGFGMHGRRPRSSDAYGRKSSSSTNNSSSKSLSGEGERTLLEMKRERRSRARMVAEARSQREYELNSSMDN